MVDWGFWKTYVRNDRALWRGLRSILAFPLSDLKAVMSTDLNPFTPVLFNPRPWLLKKVESATDPFDGCYDWIIYVEGLRPDLPETRLASQGIQDDQDLNNAKLMRAAPELFESITNAYFRLCDADRYGPEMKSSADLCRADAKEILKKAIKLITNPKEVRENP